MSAQSIYLPTNLECDIAFQQLYEGESINNHPIPFSMDRAGHDFQALFEYMFYTWVQNLTLIESFFIRYLMSNMVGHEPDMVYPPPPPHTPFPVSKRSFVDHDFLKAQCFRSIVQHISSLAVGALRCNISL